MFESSKGDSKMQFLIENATATVLVQRFDYDFTVIFEKINSNAVI